MATQKSLQKCHQFVVMREREPIKNQTLGHQIENKGMNKTLSRFCALLPMSSKQFMFHHYHLVVSHCRCCSCCCTALILHLSSFILVVAFGFFLFLGFGSFNRCKETKGVS
jgi:hypothetical protein